MTEPTDLVIIRTYHFRYRAEADRAMLEARGLYAVIIPTDVANEDAIRLCVRREDEARARRLFFTDVKGSSET